MIAQLMEIQNKVERLILSTPTSEKRDKLTEVNILIEALIQAEYEGWKAKGKFAEKTSDDMKNDLRT